MRHLKKQFVLCIGVLIVCTSAYALTARPTVIEQRMNPGQPGVGTYIVRNDDSEPVQVTVEAEDWMGRMFGKPDEVPVEEWLIFPETQFVLQPGEVREVPFEMQAPFRFVGEKVAQVFFEFVPTSGATSLRTRLGVIVYMMAKGSEKVRAKMTDVSIAYREDIKNETVNTFGPGYRCGITVENYGNVHVRPSGTVRVRSVSDKTVVETVIVKPTRGVYPGETKQIAFEMPTARSLQPGRYRADFEIDVGSLYEKKKILKKKHTFEVTE